MGPQPSHDDFQAKLTEACQQLDGAPVVFAEHEGQYIGSVGLPPWYLRKLLAAPGIELRAPLKRRIEHVVSEYGEAPISELRDALRRIAPRLGPERTTAAAKALDHGELCAAIAVLLTYYDAAYAHQVADACAPLRVVDLGERSLDDVLDEIIAAEL